MRDRHLKFHEDRDNLRLATPLVQAFGVPYLAWLTEDGALKSIRIYLKYTPGNVPVISRIERVSRPGCRVYVGSKEVPRVLGGLGINILTTPRGVMTGSSARKENVGGEVLCHVW